ncbi:MAG: alpha-L-fucosidase [Mucilaginibacter sp.]|uniref:alpha-L-fucosidase n=1 Tax=Mucilaginibacter sp. TaxID=1882438 RepID=UPI0032650357
MKFKKLFFVIALSCLCNLSNAQKSTQDQKMKWWQDGKFGMFLHWGLYSQAAGDWKGKPYKGNEHFMIYEKLHLKEYATLANDFNPTLFNADQWVKTAKDAGMKYIVLTTKHHEGFAMYNSPSSEYNIVKKTPFKRDPVKELAAACKKNGMKFCFYYSLGRDWEDPDVATNWPTKGGRSNLTDYPNEDTKDFSKYFERKVKPQISQSR